MAGDVLRLRLIQGPEGSPNFVYGTENDDTGDSVDYVQYDWGYPSLVSKLGGELPEENTVSTTAYLTAAHDWLEKHEGEVFDVSADAEVIDA
jgi:hypothetical protein